MKSGVRPLSTLKEWLEYQPTDAEIIDILRDCLTREGAAIQLVIAERNRYKIALEVVRDNSFTSRAEMRDHATKALKPKGAK